jgi:hypothetical protein
MLRRLTITGVVCAALGAAALAQGNRPASPPGTAATQVGGHFTRPPGSDEPVYQDGKWIEITYGRPIKRGRDLWGSGADYGKALLAGAPVWRAGANVSTRLKSEVPLVINGKTVPAGEYSLFIDLEPSAWTLIVSSYGAAPTGNSANADRLWGAFGYTPARDVVRAPMALSTMADSIDQLTWGFVDMTADGGSLALMWDKTLAKVPFRIGR